MPIVAGIDCSTQSTKVVLCDADSGRVLAERSGPHPDGTEVDPEAWWRALQTATAALGGEGWPGQVAAAAVGGQQHGLVALDEAGQVVRPALLWNDVRSAGSAEALVRELGGPAAWASAVGSVPVASFTVTKLRWVAEHEPERASRIASVLLPHDWVTWRLAGGGEPVTDRGDASGTGYWSPSSGSYREDLLELAFGRAPALPRVLPPSAVAGETPTGAVLGPGTGDNMAAGLGLGAGPGDVVVSIGTSGTVFAVHEAPSHDASGIVAGFADATGRFLPLVCTLNAARVLSGTAAVLGVELAELDQLALRAPAGAGGLVLLPYLDGERTPNLPDASGLLAGLRLSNMEPENLARAAVEGVLCGLADGLDALRAQGIPVQRVLLVGGGSRSAAVQALAPLILDAPMEVPEPAEYVALGAARQAAWALAGTPEPPLWPLAQVAVHGPADGGAAGAGVRARYAEVREGAIRGLFGARGAAHASH
jgi:xylulokinase